jgi:hypothetical protein
MKEANCNGDIFWAPVDGDLSCLGHVTKKITIGASCAVKCVASYATPDKITCLQSGWDTDVDRSTCDATKGGLGPVGQIMLIVVFLVLLSLGTFAWQKYRRSQVKPEDAAAGPKYAGDVPAFNREKSYGMGRDGFDNLQTVNLGEMSPLPQPKNRPGGGYHPAGAGIHDFMGTCTIGTVSQNPKLGQWNEDPKNLA